MELWDLVGGLINGLVKGGEFLLVLLALIPTLINYVLYVFSFMIGNIFLTILIVEIFILYYTHTHNETKMFESFIRGNVDMVKWAYNTVISVLRASAHVIEALNPIG